MIDNNTIERIETSEREFQSDDLTLRLERKIQELEEEMTNMCNLSRLSISLGTPFCEKHGVTLCHINKTYTYPEIMEKDLQKQVQEDVVHQLPSPDEDQRNSTYVDPADKLNLLLDSLASSDVLNQRKAAKEIRVLIKKQPSLRAVFGVCGDAVTKLLNPLSENVNTHPELREDLITTLLNISIHDSNKKLVAQNPVVIPLLVQSLKFGTLRTRSNSAAALSTLSALDSNKYVIVKAGALKPLIDLLDEGELLAINDAASAIFSLIVVHQNKGEAISEGIIKVILMKLR